MLALVSVGWTQGRDFNHEPPKF